MHPTDLMDSRRVLQTVAFDTAGNLINFLIWEKAIVAVHDKLDMEDPKII